MKQFLIKFGDNDFGNTLMAFGKLVVDHNDDFLTKERIVILWNELAYGLYLIAQNQFYQHTIGDPNFKSDEHTRNYLKITPDMVYVNDDARKYIDEHQGEWNHSWLFVDLPNETVTLV